MTDTVLLVEDNDDLRRDLAFLLTRKGFHVVTAANGKEALQLMHASGPPCIILLDLMMPVMDGWTLRSELLKDPRLANVPIVLLSGVADLQREAAQLKAAYYLRKPIDLDRLYKLVESHC